jgi:hypothetical protein
LRHSAPGVIAQLQPLFIARRDIFEAREKKAKMYRCVCNRILDSVDVCGSSFRNIVLTSVYHTQLVGLLLRPDKLGISVPGGMWHFIVSPSHQYYVLATMFIEW